MKRFRDLSLTVKLNIALITLLAAIFAFSFIWMRREVRNLLTGEISRTAQMSVELGGPEDQRRISGGGDRRGGVRIGAGNARAG